MFWIGEGKEAEFEDVFGPTGPWNTFLRRSEGYRGTEIKCESQAERRFRVLDFWTTHCDFEAFRSRFAADYDRFNRLVSEEGLVEKQVLVGTYRTNLSRVTGATRFQRNAEPARRAK
jgi:hypothetical protein